jgi:hypothetical protein
MTTLSTATRSIRSVTLTFLSEEITQVQQRGAARVVVEWSANVKSVVENHEYKSKNKRR